MVRRPFGRRENRLLPRCKRTFCARRPTRPYSRGRPSRSVRPSPEASHGRVVKRDSAIPVASLTRRVMASAGLDKSETLRLRPRPM